jgi:hypothetical protein
MKQEPLRDIFLRKAKQNLAFLATAFIIIWNVEENRKYFIVALFFELSAANNKRSKYVHLLCSCCNMYTNYSHNSFLQA